MVVVVTMRSIAIIFFAFSQNRGGLTSTISSISGFTPSIHAKRIFRNKDWPPVGQFWGKDVTICRRSWLSGYQGTGTYRTKGSDSEEKKKKNWLVVGDGDLSYSATIAGSLAKKNVNLFATVLESEQQHNATYKRSSQNKETILSCLKYGNNVTFSETTENTKVSLLQHQVQFGIDATRLQDFFPTDKFRKVIFNFPHWGGKTNAKRNRKLVNSFLASACKILHEEGEIIVSLCEGQGGFPSSSLNEWKQSWLVPEYGAEHGLLLRRLEPYEPTYQQTSHRGMDRPWVKSGKSQRYTFSFPNRECIEKDLQISCRHELRIVLPKIIGGGSKVSRNDIIDGDAVLQLTKSLSPEGIQVEVAERKILHPFVFNGKEATLANFMLNYSGESMPLTRANADNIRSQVEASVVQQWELEIARAGELVSRPYPTHLLPILLKESHEKKQERLSAEP